MVAARSNDPERRGALTALAISACLAILLAVGCQPARSATSDVQAAVPVGPALSLAVDAGNGSLLEAAGGLFRSTDQGRTWQPLPLPADLKPSTLVQVATTSAAASLYAAGPGAGVLRSDDAGQTWRRISSGLPSQEVGALAVHSFRPDTIYAWIKGQGIFRTEDSGGRWQKMDDGPSATIATLAHSTLEGSMNTGWLYAATPDGPYLSMDCF